MSTIVKIALHAESAKEDVLGIPHLKQQRETYRECEETMHFDPKLAEGLGHFKSDHQQSHREGEHAVTKGFDTAYFMAGQGTPLCVFPIIRPVLHKSLVLLPCGNRGSNPEGSNADCGHYKEVHLLQRNREHGKRRRDLPRYQNSALNPAIQFARRQQKLRGL